MDFPRVVNSATSPSGLAQRWCTAPNTPNSNWSSGITASTCGTAIARPGGPLPSNIALSADAHAATKSVYRDWLKEITGKPVGGKIDWETISNREMQQLSERMFDAARVPAASRDAYYRALNECPYTGSFNPVVF